jgi:hypothetical protein
LLTILVQTFPMRATMFSRFPSAFRRRFHVHWSAVDGTRGGSRVSYTWYGTNMRGGACGALRPWRGMKGRRARRGSRCGRGMDGPRGRRLFVRRGNSSG